MHIYKHPGTSKLLPDFYSPGNGLQGKLFMFFHHADTQSSSKQTQIRCSVFSIAPTIWEIISFDLLEERMKGEADLSKKVFYSKPKLLRPLNRF